MWGRAEGMAAVGAARMAAGGVEGMAVELTLGVLSIQTLLNVPKTLKSRTHVGLGTPSGLLHYRV